MALNGVLSITGWTPVTRSRAAGGKGNFGRVLDQAMANPPYEETFQRLGSAYGISSALLKAVAAAESDFNPRAVSPSGAVGLMQFMPGTAAALGIDPWNPVESIEGAARYLRQLIDRFGGRVDMGIAAYNAGPGAVQRYGGIPPYQETKNYVRRVLDLYHKYEGETGAASAAASPAGSPGLERVQMRTDTVPSNTAGSIDHSSDEIAALGLLLTKTVMLEAISDL